MNCATCRINANMLAPVNGLMVCERCWEPERRKLLPFYAQSRTYPTKRANADGKPIVMLLSEATMRSASINNAASNANQYRRENPDLFGHEPTQEPTDYAAAPAEDWEGVTVPFRAMAKAVM